MHQVVYTCGNTFAYLRCLTFVYTCKIQVRIKSRYIIKDFFLLSVIDSVFVSETALSVRKQDRLKAMDVEAGKEDLLYGNKGATMNHVTRGHGIP